METVGAIVIRGIDATGLAPVGEASLAGMLCVDLQDGRRSGRYAANGTTDPRCDQAATFFDNNSVQPKET